MKSNSVYSKLKDLGEPGRPGAVSAVDLGVHGQVVESGSKDPVVGVRQDGSEWLHCPLPGLIEHLALQLGELVLQLGVVVGEGVHDGRVDGPVDPVIGGTQVLGSL